MHLEYYLSVWFIVYIKWHDTYSIERQLYD